MAPRSRAWCFTWNNYDDADIWLQRILLERTVLETDAAPGGEVRDVRYCCFQREIGSCTLTPHLQGYIFMKTMKTLAQMKTFFSQPLPWAKNGNDVVPIYEEMLEPFIRSVQTVPHLEVAKGTPQQNKDYCSKAEGPEPEGGRRFIEFGSLPQKGERKDIKKEDELDECADAIVEGTLSASDCALTYPSLYVRHNKGLNALQSALIKPRSGSVDPVVHWWFGATGTGKSRKAHQDFPEAYWKMEGNHWWDGYFGQSVVVIDDYRTSCCPFQQLLRWLDRYPMMVEFKGGSVNLAATTFVITTPLRPEVTWSLRTEEALGQLLRRISSILEFHGDGSQTVWKSNTPPTVDYVIVPHERNPFVSTFNRLDSGVSRGRQL